MSGFHQKMSRTQRNLLSIRLLTYAMAHDRCLEDEMAERANREDMGDSAVADTNKVQTFGSYKGKKKASGNRSSLSSGGNVEKCNCCDGTAYRVDSCRFKNAICHHCQRRGHIRPVCKARLSEIPGLRKPKNANVNTFGSDDEVCVDG